jgi:hypothetical protein
MSEGNSPPSSSSPTSDGGLFLRVILAAVVLAGIGGVIWYMNR